MIVDCHTHLNRYSAEEPASLAERHALLLGEMDACGVDRALVLTSYKVDDDRPSTADVLAALESDDRLDVVAGVCVSRLAFEMPELRAFLFEGACVFDPATQVLTVPELDFRWRRRMC
ncbi:MAG TPA: hypothetical protein VFE05_08185 [Longimicrobiaceae bacterium]|nr:hypothetical protein [Longimicrobiaceae bacterium]